MFRSLKRHELEHEKEKLKMIIAIARRIEERYGEKLDKDGRMGLKGYCTHIEKLAFEDEVDLKKLKQALKFVDEEINKIEEEIKKLESL